jgi:hypothetical protein
MVHYLLFVRSSHYEGGFLPTDAAESVSLLYTLENLSFICFALILFIARPAGLLYSFEWSGGDLRPTLRSTSIFQVDNSLS